MSPLAQSCCRNAVQYIHVGHYAHAIFAIRTALKQTSDRRAWSKLMLAIRELSRLEVQP